MEAAELKRRLLSLLREDEEFRYAVAGLLGLDTILLELKALREDFNEHVKLEEKRWEENEKRWEEAYRRFERIEEELRALREESVRLRLDFNKLYEQVNRRLDSFERKLIALGARWGVESEEAFREAMKGILERILGTAMVERWTYFDSEGEVFGHPAQVEVDLLIRDGVHVLVEVKASVSDADVAKLWRVGRLYEKATGVKPRLVIVSPFVDERAIKLAGELGVEVYAET
uniref:DUF3782 domain-containing protein n=1 Tax=Thermofilum pendens TaxID=2269 RepID=A0A7C4BA55_THEPE